MDEANCRRATTTALCKSLYELIDVVCKWIIQ